MDGKLQALIVACVLLLGQVGVFYLYALHCASSTGWEDEPATTDEVRVLVVSDIHLLGKRRRTWLERVWIDWQVAISLRFAGDVHDPEMVLVLGDQFDEGGYPTPDVDWEEYALRFNYVFASLQNINAMYLLGNHDAAFGRYLRASSIQRHERAFGPANRLATVKGHQFIQLNTMALDSDVTKPDVKALAETFLETFANERSNVETNHSVILLTHLPLYREDDLACGPERLHEGGHITYEHPSFRYDPHRHVLSQELSKRLVASLEPTTILSGHTHAWCAYQHQPTGPMEFTIPAFSWGQRPDPGYALLRVSGARAQVVRCSLPEETPILLMYGTTILVVVIMRLCPWVVRCLTWRSTTFGHSQGPSKKMS